MRTHLVLAAGLGLLVCACSNQRPAVDPQLNSGITSSNGGGQRATGAIPNFGVGPNGAAVTPGAPAGTGNAY
ncbi:MAG: hypothetical protein JOZ05_22470 [Acetobacteraceae bacterium]|nr:hypothetical protein [Acetobacteraceae bacterium]